MTVVMCLPWRASTSSTSSMLMVRPFIVILMSSFHRRAPPHPVNTEHDTFSLVLFTVAHPLTRKSNLLMARKSNLLKMRACCAMIWLLDQRLWDGMGGKLSLHSAANEGFVVLCIAGEGFVLCGRARACPRGPCSTAPATPRSPARATRVPAPSLRVPRSKKAERRASEDLWPHAPGQNKQSDNQAGGEAGSGKGEVPCK